MNKEIYHIWLSQAPGMTPRSAWKLYSQYENIEAIYKMSYQEIACFFSTCEHNIGSGFIKKNSEESWQTYKNKCYEIEKYYYKILDKGVQILLPDKPAFPQRLREIEDCPLALYVKGHVDFSKPAIGIVGSRRATDYGRAMAKYFAKELSRQGIHVISGLAYGIDIEAHKGCLENKGQTSAVLGGGLHACYPQKHHAYFQEIQYQGCVLSEEPYGRGVEPYMFPKRNRLISGISEGVLVVEAAKKSGSLITADFALEQGRDVYAVPGRLFDKACQGTNDLIRQGAKPVFDVDDILNDLLKYEQYSLPNKNESEKKLEEKEKIVYSCISYDSIHIEHIIQQVNKQKQKQCSLHQDEIMILLLKLEMKGFIKKKSGCYYTRLEV